MFYKKRATETLMMAAILIAGLSTAQAEDKAPSSIWTQETLTGDWGGARTTLEKDRGIKIKLEYMSEAFGIFSGGLKRGSTYEGRFDFSVDTDLEKFFGSAWKGASTHFTVYQIHNGGKNAADYVGSIADPSNIDALSTTRLFTAWFQQGDPGKDRFSLRIGQLAADDEFITSTTASGLINGTFGWAGILAANIASGGPAYPLATPGVRVQVKPTDDTALLAAVFSGDPAGDNCVSGIPQSCNRHGTTFSFTGGALFMTEAQYAVNQDEKATGRAAAYKLGAWYATDDYADQRFGLTAGGVPVSLADPTAVASLNHRGNWGIYGVIDQMLWGSNASGKSVSVFVRSGFSPSDRNLLSGYVDGGINFKGLAPNRPNDVLTFGAAYADISRDASALDRDTLALNGPPFPIRDHEAVFEASYAIQIAPWWTLQPDLQYIIHPGGNVQDPSNPNRAVKDAFLGAVRSTIRF
jgi:porin